MNEHPETTDIADLNVREKSKPKKRKRHKKIRKHLTKFRMIYCNINHAKSKIDSLKRIIEEENPVVIILVETKLGEKEDLSVEGYETYPLNRDENGGGIMIIVKKQLENIIVTVEKKQEVGETMWITIANGRNNIRLGVIYAPQENKTSVPKLKEMYKGLAKQIKESRTRKQNLLLVGDFNCKVGNAIKGNSEEVSKGGKLLMQMIQKQDLMMVNASEKCQGKWTRTDGSKQSVLDYVLINKEDEDLVKSMVIDENREYTPNHTQGGRTIYSDHFAIKVDINWNMRHKPGETRRTIINEKSNAAFTEMTSHANLSEIWKTTNDTQTKYSLWSKAVSEIAEAAYKVKKKKKKDVKGVRMLRKRKKEIKIRFQTATPEERETLTLRKKLIDEHIGNYRKEENRSRTVDIARKIKSEKGFDGSAFWEYRRRSNGRKQEEMTAIKNEDGELEEDPKQILEIYKKFYQKLLTGKEMMTEAGKEVEEMVNKYVDIVLSAADKQRMEPFTDKEYQQMKKELKARKAPDLQGWRYEMVKHAGDDLDKSILTMINEMTHNNVVADEWEEMIIKAISKGKGDLQAMGSKRGLFLTNILSKVVEKLIKNRTKPTVESGMSEFQCGGVTKRGIGDNLLIVNSVVEEFRAEKKDLFILFADLEKCFDQLWLRDCIKELVEAGMPIAEAAYLFKMNERVKAIVETPIGKTEPFELREIVRQGTVSAVDMCGVSTDKINRLKEWEQPLMVSEVVIKHPVYVDDMIGLGTPAMIEAMEPKMKYLEESKKYVYNNEAGKTEIMKMELSPKQKPNQHNPKVTVMKGEVGYTNTYKCLGDQYDKSGRNMSKINKKMTKTNFIAAEVKRQGSHERVGNADTSVRLLLLEIVVKPTLLSNTETWVNITNEELKAVNKGHYAVLRKVFEQKKSTPYYGILMEIGSWPYSYVIVYKRLMYFHHLMHSDERRTTRKIILNQMKGIGKGKTWYGNGVQPWLTKLNMDDLEDDIMDIKKSEWKRKLKEEIENCVAKELEEHSRNMTKLRFTTKFQRQRYVTECRMEKVKKIMKMRLNMVELKANFKGKYEDTTCAACRKAVETTEHVIECEEYRKITGHSLKQMEWDNLAWLEEACEVYEQIEEVRNWII